MERGVEVSDSLQCPYFFQVLAAEPSENELPSQIDELAVQMMVTDTVRRHEPLIVGNDRNGRQSNAYRLGFLVQSQSKFQFLSPHIFRLSINY